MNCSWQHISRVCIVCNVSSRLIRFQSKKIKNLNVIENINIFWMFAMYNFTHLKASTSIALIWFRINLTDSTVTGEMASFSTTTRPASTISMWVTPGIGKSRKIKWKRRNWILLLHWPLWGHHNNSLKGMKGSSQLVDLP